MTQKKDLKNLNSGFEEFENKRRQLALVSNRSLELYQKYESLQSRFERLHKRSNKTLSTVFTEDLQLRLNTVMSEIRAIQTRQFQVLIKSDYFNNYFVNLNKSLNSVVKVYANQLALLPRLIDIMGPIIQAQLQFRNDYLKIISRSLNTYSVLDQISRQWTQTLISFHADILGLKVDFQYTRKDYKERRQIVIELDQGINENGLVTYQTIEKDGKKYKLVEIPEENHQKLINAYTGVIFDSESTKLAISTQTTTILEVNQNISFRYDSRTATLFIGNYQRTLARGFVHRSLSMITKNKTNMKMIWYYKDLLDELGSKSDKVLKTGSSKPNVNKNCYNKFKYIKDNLPPEIKDFLTVKSDHVYIDAKYIK